METMSALLRIAGDLNMTVKVTNVTPAEALLLMHVHDPAVKDVFEGAVLTDSVRTSKTDERQRLREKYPEQAKLIDYLFPGRNAADVPDSFGDLQDVPLEVTKQAKEKDKRALHESQVRDAEPTGPRTPPEFTGVRFPEPEPIVPTQPGPSRLLTADSMRQHEVAQRANISDVHREIRNQDHKAQKDVETVEQGLADPKQNPPPYDPGPESTFHPTTNEGTPNPNWGPDAAGRNTPDGWSDEPASDETTPAPGPTDRDVKSIMGDEAAPAPAPKSSTRKK